MKEIQTPAGKILCVKVGRAYDFEIVKDSLYYYTRQSGVRVDLPQGNWQILNTASKLTEEQAKELVEKITYKKWKNYLLTSQYEEYLLESALKSFYSLMSHNVCFLENPYREYTTHNLYFSEQWQQAEENTGEWLILIEKK